MDDVLIVVDDLEAVKAFFIELGLKLEGETTVEGPSVGSLIDATATAGWYNNQAFDRTANASGLYARSLNADAFAGETKEQVAQIVRDDLGGLDVLIYSLASPVRRDPDGTVFRSAIKPIGRSVRLKTLHVEKGVVSYDRASRSRFGGVGRRRTPITPWSCLTSLAFGEISFESSASQLTASTTRARSRRSHSML